MAKRVDPDQSLILQEQSDLSPAFIVCPDLSKNVGSSR